MLGHEDLRVEVAKGIKEKFLGKYQDMLAKIGKEKMDNEEVKAFCKDNKINLNKFGKYSNHICIYSVQELDHLIDYTWCKSENYVIVSSLLIGSCFCTFYDEFSRFLPGNIRQNNSFFRW